MAIIQYTGDNRRWYERIRLPMQRKDAAFPAAEAIQYTSFLSTFTATTIDNFIKYGYKQNPTVFACVSALAGGFSEPQLCVYDAEYEKVDNHPLKVLLQRPNMVMGEDELWQYVMVYMALTGNAYIHKVRTNGGKVAELWPYHGGKMRAVPSGSRWVDHYEYYLGSGKWEPVPFEDVIHIKWLVDPEEPWHGISPLSVVARDVDISNELTRFLKALVQNDAVMRGILTPGPDKPLSPEAAEKLKAEFNKRFGGENRGGVAIAAPGMTYTRMALNMAELDLTSLTFVPDVNICKAFRVPPVVALTLAGLEHGTYSNYEQERAAFTQGTLTPKWKGVAAEVQSSLLPDFGGGGYSVGFDLDEVEALKENLAAKAVWVLEAWGAGVFTLNETRGLLGEDPVEGPEGDEYKAPPPAPVMAAPEPAEQEAASEVVNEDEGNDDEQTEQYAKALPAPRLETKAVEDRVAKIAGKMQRAMQKELEDAYERIAGHVG